MLNSNSQLGQDLIAKKFFKFNPSKNKLFVDVGAFDGLHFSNTFLFFQDGWSGVCVEACSKNFKKLQKLYAGTEVKTIKSACSNYSGKAYLNIATIPGSEDWGSDVSSLNSCVLDRFADYT